MCLCEQERKSKTLSCEEQNEHEHNQQPAGVDTQKKTHVVVHHRLREEEEEERNELHEKANKQNEDNHKCVSSNSSTSRLICMQQHEGETCVKWTAGDQSETVQDTSGDESRTLRFRARRYR